MAHFDFSVIVALRGSQKELDKTITSIKAQQKDAGGIQLILAGDPAGYPALAEAEGITLARCAAGPAAALWNEGLALAEGEYVNFLCAGNAWAAGAFAAAKARLGARPELPAACCRVRRPADKGKFTDPGEFRFKKDDVIEIEGMHQYLLDSVENLIFRRSAVEGLRFEPEAGMAAEALFAYRVLQRVPRYGVAPDAVFCRDLRDAAAFPAEEYERVLGCACPAFLEETRAAKAAAGAVLQGLTGSAEDHLQGAAEQTEISPQGLDGSAEDHPQGAAEEAAVSPQGAAGPADGSPHGAAGSAEGGEASSEETEVFLPAELELPPSALYGQYACAWFVKELLIGPAEGVDKDRAEAVRAEMKELLQDVDDQCLSGMRKAINAYRLELLRIKHGEKADFDRSFVTKKYKAEAAVLRIEMGAIHLEGCSRADNAGALWRVYAKDDRGDRFELARYKAACFDKKTFDDKYALQGMSWWVNLPLSAGRKYKFYLYSKETGAKQIQVQFGKFARLSNTMESSYFVEEGMLVTYKSGVIAVKKATAEAVQAAEAAYCKELEEKGKAHLIPFRKKAIAMNEGSGHGIRRRKTWIVAGEPGTAAGNGEALYRAMQGMGRKAEVFYAADPVKEGALPAGTLELGSDEYISRLLSADLLFVCRSDEKAYNPFGADRDYMKDLYRFKIVFLPQEAMRLRRPDRFHKTRLDAVLFCCAGKREQLAVQDELGYYAKETALTGLPRWDLLEGTPKKSVCFLPTPQAFTDQKSSAFYRALVSDPALLAGMKELGYTGVLAAPSEAKAKAAGFADSEVIRIGAAGADRTALVNGNGLLVTNGDGPDADFAYAGRPVIYAGEGAAEAGKGGFGPVCGGVEEAAQAILERLRENCARPEAYEARAEKFFAFRDKGNCRRVLEAVERIR